MTDSLKTAVALLACCVLSLPCFGQTKGKTEWGEKFNSAGATLVVKEAGRVRTDGRTVITYNLFASGLPKELEYTLWTKLPGSDPQAVADVFLNKDGLVVSQLSDPANSVAEDPINLKIVAGRGELKQFGVISNDAKYRVFGQIVPFPIAATGGPCSISVTMMGPNYSAVFLVVTGLQPREEFQIHQRSGNEGADSKATAADDGSYRTLVYPFVKGQASGKLKFAVTGRACSVNIDVPWDQGSYAIQ